MIGELNKKDFEKVLLYEFLAKCKSGLSSFLGALSFSLKNSKKSGLEILSSAAISLISELFELTFAVNFVGA